MEGLRGGGIRKEASLWRGFDGGPSIVVEFLRAAVWRPGSVMRLDCSRWGFGWAGSSGLGC